MIGLRQMGVMALTVALLGSPAFAATFTVTTTVDGNDGVCDGHCTLRDAVLEANALPGPDSVVIPAGSYLLSLAGAFEDAALTGDLDLTDDVSLEGASASTTIVDGQGLDRVFHVRPGVTASIQDLTVEGGDSGTSGGGGISNQGALEVTDCVVSGNLAGFGGGLVQSIGAATLVITGTEISGNVAATNGGGIYSNATLTVSTSEISGNSATSGGGLHLTGLGSATVTDSRIDGNGANSGAGIHVVGGSTSVERSTIDGNGASSGGGGVSVGLAGTISLTNVTFSGNGATSNGGALRNVGVATLTHVTMSGDGAPAGVVNTLSGASTTFAGSAIEGDCIGSGTYTSEGGNVESPGGHLQLHRLDRPGPRARPRDRGPG